MKTISIFGSTGSIGTNCLEVIRKSPSGNFVIQALVANTNYKLLAKQAIEFKVKIAAIFDQKYYSKLKDLLAHTDVKVSSGMEGIEEACALKSDAVVGAIVGIAGLMPIYHAISYGSDILLANKESLVCAGSIIKDAIKKKGVNLVPIDSEHNAIFQLFDQKNRKAIDKIILTASGGPFRTFTSEQINKVTVEQALKHPTWNMGAKVTIDSATLMNKALEIIEAHYLFDMEGKDIDVVVHPQSIIHGMVEYKDGSVLAQLSVTDMKIPILHSLYYPKRYSDHQINTSLDFGKLQNLTFEKPREDLFPSLYYARNALKKGSAAQILLNAANEVVVEQFLQHKIKFTDIFRIIGQLLDDSSLYKHEVKSINDVLRLDKAFREITYENVRKNWLYNL